MSEYIERETVNELICNYGKGAIEDGRKTLDPVDDIICLAKGLDLVPAADVAPVVRCKDCSHCSIEGSLYLCALWNHLTELDDFCSDAKRWEETA